VVFGYQHDGPTDKPWYSMVNTGTKDAYQFFMDIIFEKAFLEKLAHNKYSDFDSMPLQEQNQIKSSIVKDLLHRDQSELDTMQNNSDNFRVQTPDFEMMMRKKLSGLKRKMDVKNYLLKQLSPRI
jgi:hypothetical protein